MLMPSIFKENLLDDFFTFPETPVRTFDFTLNGNGLMKTDIKETDGSYEFDISMPGVAKEDIKAKVNDGYLTVSATANSEKDEKDDEGHYIRRERYSGAMSRSFYVGDHVKQEDIHAKYESGVLSLTVPKVDPAKIEKEEESYIAIEG